MSNTTFEWHFPSTDGGEHDGINDPLRETFEGDHERYIARESIQNSLDARKDLSRPVLVKFERIEMAVSDIPGLKDLKVKLEQAREFSKDQDKSKSFYDNALTLIDQRTISVLKISDFNTVGLTGSDNDTSGRWYKLTKGVGVNSMAGVGGGSFGIGKGAPFAASGLRTVFYSSMDESGNSVFKGKSRLSSFKDIKGDVRRGIGDYGIPIERGVSSARNPEDIPDLFKRTEVGTDVYVIGYQTLENDWTKLLLNSLLNSFWAAVYFNELDVQLIDNSKIVHDVDESNLEELMSEYASGKSESYNFFKTVDSPSKLFETKLPILGEVSLFVKTAEGYPKAVQMMRKSKMAIYTIDNYRVLPEPYAAVFVCDDENGNKFLRNLEPPAHDAWDPERDKKNGKPIYRELTDWIRDSLRSISDGEDNKPEDIPDLGRWLPEDDDRDDENPMLGPVGERSDIDKDRNTESVQEVGVSKTSEEANKVDIRRRKVSLTKKLAAGEGGTLSGEKNGKKSGKKTGVDPDEVGDINGIDTANLRFRAREVVSKNDRAYKLVITPYANDNGSLQIVAIGEDNDYPVEIESVINEKGENLDFKHSRILNLELLTGERRNILITLKNKKRYALGVN